MSNRDDGLRSLRCCKRRSVVSNLRGFGNKWASSRLRIAILHPAPVRPGPFAAFARSASSSQLALAAVAGLSLQGHSVSLYTSGYRQKDIPDYLWETSGDVKTCLPRLFRLALFPVSGSRCEWGNTVVSILISVRVILSCLVAYVLNFLWSLLPVMVQRARPGARHNSALLDVIITFEDAVLPHVLLSPFVGEIVHFPIYKSLSEILGHKIFSSVLFNLSRCDLVVGTTDHESISWSMLSLPLQVATVYAPVIAAVPSVLTPTSSSRRLSMASPSGPSQYEERINQIKSGSRPFFVSLAWYPDFSDLLLAVEAFSLFLASHQPTEQSEPEEDGCTGSARVLHLPRLVVAGVDRDNHLLLLREINRYRLTENDDIIVLDSGLPPALLAELMESSIGLIHTPGEVNQVRIPCAGMLAARPVITTVSFSQSEPVRHESTGILVKARSAHVLAQTIDNLFTMSVNRTAEWARQGLRGRQRVVTEFSIEMFGSRLDDVFESRFKNRGGLMGSPAAQPLVITRTRSASGSARGLSIHSGLNELVSTALLDD